MAPRLTYHFGPFALHAASRLLVRDGAVVPLASKAFETLVALVRRAGAVVAKDELLREVWPNAVVEESNLTQTIFMLRRALGDDVREHRFIVTVPKQGYSFVAPVRARAEPGDAAEGPPAVARALLGRRHAESTEAHQLCLKGRHFWARRTAGAVEKAIRCFQQALEKDPRSALAYAGLADCYAILSQCSRLPPDDTMPRARAAALEALGIDEATAEAHASLGLVKMLYDWDWDGAGAEFERARALDPGYATAHHWHGMLMAARGRVTEAVAALERAQQLDPLSVAINTDLGLVLYLARRYDEAVSQYRAAIDLDPTFTDAQTGLLMAYGEMGMPLQPISEFMRAPEAVSREAAAALESAFVRSGVRGYWRALLDLADAPSSEVRCSPYVRARLCAAVGDVPRALQWLETARDVRDAGLSLVRVDPGLDTLRAEPRFRVVLEQVGLVDRLTNLIS